MTHHCARLIAIATVSFSTPITAQQAAGYKAAITKLQKKVEILEEKLKRALWDLNIAKM